MVSSVLITGGLGGLGSAVVRHIIENTTGTVAILDNLSSPSFDVRSLGSRVALHRGNVCNEVLVSYLLEKYSVDTVIDCSTRASPKKFLDASHSLKNFTHLLEAVRVHKGLKHFVLTSRLQHEFEDQPLYPGEFGLASLMSAEAMLHSYVISYRLPLVTARVGYLPENIEELQVTPPFNLISPSDAAKGIFLTLSAKPASVYNIVGAQDYNPATGDLFSTKFSSKKTQTELGFVAGPVTVTRGVREIPTGLERVLLFGNGTAYEKLREELREKGVELKEAETWPGLNSDKEVSDELTHVAPSHIVCVCTSPLDEGNGTPCERLKINTYGLLFPPWQLASMSEKRGIHYTFIGSDNLFSPEELAKAPLIEEINGNNQETNQGPIKAYTERLLSHFNEALKFRLNEIVITSSSIKKIIHLLLSRANGLWNVVEPGAPSHLDGTKFEQYMAA